MNSPSVTLVVSSALFHSLWNFLLKRSDFHNKRLLISFAFLTSIIIFLPLFLLNFQHGSIIYFASWIIILSAFLKFLYFTFIIKAYKKGDLSFVYPLSRISVILVPIFAYFFTGELVSALGKLGILTIFIGSILIVISNQDKPRLSLLKNQTLANSLYVAVVIAAYSIVDKIAVAKFQPLVFIYLMFFYATLFFLFFGFFNSTKKELRIILKYRWQEILLISVLCPISYLLLLFAFMTSEVSYVFALRQLSLFFAVIMGGQFLGEKNIRRKLIAVSIIFLGFFLIIIAE